jgi:hypothetical protein
MAAAGTGDPGWALFGSSDEEAEPEEAEGAGAHGLPPAEATVCGARHTRYENRSGIAVIYFALLDLVS